MSGVDTMDLPLSKEEIANIGLFTDNEKKSRN